MKMTLRKACSKRLPTGATLSGNSYYDGFDTSFGNTYNDRWNIALVSANIDGLDDDADFRYFEYETFVAVATSHQYDPEHASITTVVTDGAGFWMYFDEAGQPLSRLTTTPDDTDVYQFVSRGEVGITSGVDGTVEMIAEPLACAFSSDPNPTGGTYVAPTSLRTNTAIETESEDGALIRIYPRVQSGAYTGFMSSKSWQSVANLTATRHGPHAIEEYDYLTPVYDDATATDVGDDYLVVRPLVAKERRYNNYKYNSTDPLYYDEISYSYEFHAEAINGGGTTDPGDPQWLAPRKIRTTYPIVSTMNNGSGVAATSDAYYRADDTMIFRGDETDVYFYTGLVDNQLIKQVDDVRLSILGVFVGDDNPADYFSPIPIDAGNAELKVTTTYTRDEVGRETSRTTPSGRVITHRYEELADGRLARVSSMGESGSAYLGPFDYLVWNDNRRVHDDAKIGVASTSNSPSAWLDDTESDPILAASLGDLSSLALLEWNPPGGMLESKNVYHLIPSSGSGGIQTNYDSEAYEYDGAGYLVEQTYMSGTIRSVERDSRGLIIDRFISSYDPSPLTSSTARANQDAGGGQNDANGDEMGTSCSCVVSAQDSCLRLTGGTTLAAGDYQYQRDLFGRMVFLRTAAQPYYAARYDNLGRMTSAAVYSSDDFSSSGLNFNSNRSEIDPDIYTEYDPEEYDPFHLTENRVAFVSIDYDERGRVVRRSLHEISSVAGHEGELTGQSLIWSYTYDKAGREVLKQGNELVKRQYDRLGREVATYELSGIDDTAYADASTVSGDVVERETHRILNTKTGQVLLEAVTDRTANDYGSSEHRGSLDSNSYTTIASTTINPANLEGRVQIKMNSYDALDRLTQEADFGTGGTDASSTFDPDAGSMPDSLATAYAYDVAGRIATITDPLGRVDLRLYDATGRLTQRVENYISFPTGADDENRTTEWTYLNGQLFEYIAHEGAGTQTTTYSYAPSGTGGDDYPSRDELRSITYPDSGVEKYIYESDNSRLAKRIDAAGNVIEFGYDRPGRVNQLDLTAATGFDGAVASVQLTYGGIGQLATVTQYDSGSSEIDSVEIEYDGWSNLSSFIQDPDGGSDSTTFDEKTLAYAWALADPASGRQALRMSGKTLPGGAAIGYDYETISGSNGGPSSMSRVSSVSYDSTIVSEYDYMGVDRVMETRYPTNTTYAVYSSLRDSSGDFDALDDYNRPVHSRWNRQRAYNAPASEVPFYDITVLWDDSSNVTGITDHVYPDFFNYEFENDALNRLVGSTRGDGSGNSVTLPAVEVEGWDLTNVGNWDGHDLELTGDNPPDYSDTGEFQATGTFNDVNEMPSLELDTDDDGVTDVTFSRSYNDRGDLTDDGEHYTFVYDVLGRLVEIRARGAGDLLSQYRYNGLGYRTGERIDTDADGVIESGETDWRSFIYDASWRLIEVYEDSDETNPSEVYVHHGAGLDGVGTGSYIDHLILRDRDTNADGTLDEFHFYCQNWRADVVAILDEAGAQLEQIRYSSYGVPILIPFADQHEDGVLNFYDSSDFTTRYGSSSYEVRADYNLDGKMDFFDVSGWQGQYNAPVDLGRGVLSNYGERFGYAGYWYVAERGLYHVRNRWYDPENGSWLTRDSYGYIDGTSLYAYTRSIPLAFVDPYGNWGMGDVYRGLGTIGSAVIGVVKVYHYGKAGDGDPSIQTEEDAKAEKLTKQTPGRSRYHTHTGDNSKYINERTGEEYIFDKDGNLVTDPQDIGTRNDGFNDISHFCIDMVPYYIWGNTPDDPTPVPGRIGGPGTEAIIDAILRIL